MTQGFLSETCFYDPRSHTLFFIASVFLSPKRSQAFFIGEFFFMTHGFLSPKRSLGSPKIRIPAGRPKRSICNCFSLTKMQFLGRSWLPAHPGRRQRRNPYWSWRHQGPPVFIGNVFMNKSCCIGNVFLWPAVPNVFLSRAFFYRTSGHKRFFIGNALFMTQGFLSETCFYDPRSHTFFYRKRFFSTQPAPSVS